MTEPVSKAEGVEPDEEDVTTRGHEAPPEEPGEDVADTEADVVDEVEDEPFEDPPQEILDEVEAFLAGDEEAPKGPAGETALIALQEEFDALNDRHLRLAAEFNNFRRRSEQERLEAWSRAQADLVGKLLDVLDDLQRVAQLDTDNATVEAIIEGVDLVERKFVRMLGDAGVEIIDPVGEPFDPERMEAMMRVPAESDEQDDTVAQVFQKGYHLKGVLVRPARVSVHKHG